MTTSEVETHYVATKLGHYAYQVTGTGEPTILYLTGSVSHVERRWEIPHLVRLHRRLMAIGRVVTFDPLGLGASDALPDPPPTLDDAVCDYLAVIDAIGADEFVIVATQHGVPPALALAANYPTRVSKIVAIGGYARLWSGPDYPEGLDPALLDQFLDTMLPVWGTGAATSFIFGLDAADDAEIASFGRLERAAGAPGSIERLLRWITTSDVRDKLPLVQAPVLAFGVPTGIVTPDITERMVRELPHARFVHVGHDPTVRGDGLDEMMAEIAEFLTGSRALAHSDRALAAVVFTDLVGSTERAAELGDDHWRDLLGAYRLAVRREVERHDGREVNTRGDDFLVVFDRASEAIECAVAVHESVGRMGLTVRSGVHVGEVELDGDDLTGVAVHVGARVADLAEPGEILATTSAREAVAGMTWTFADRGAHALKGVPGDWHLFSVDS